MRALIRGTSATCRTVALLLLAALAIVRFSPACATATTLVTHVESKRSCADMPNMAAHHDQESGQSGMQAGGHGCVALPVTAAATPPRLALRTAPLRPARDATGIAHPAAPEAPPPRSA